MREKKHKYELIEYAGCTYSPYGQVLRNPPPTLWEMTESQACELNNTYRAEGKVKKFIRVRKFYPKNIKFKSGEINVGKHQIQNNRRIENDKSRGI